MQSEGEIKAKEYTRVFYTQFNQSKSLRLIRRVLVYIVVPFVFPFILASRASDYVFRTVSELFSLIPFLFGTVIREAFYKYTLKSCGDNVSIGFGAVFFYRNISIGDNVLIGLYCTIHHCDIGDNALVSTGCQLLSGSKHHDYERIDIPMTMQNGWMRKIRIGDDVWIGANSIVMDDVEDGCVIGAGSLVNKRIEKHSIAVGNPCRIVRKRK